MTNAQIVAKPRKKINWHITVSVAVIATVIGTIVASLPQMIASVEEANRQNVAPDLSLTMSGPEFLLAVAIGVTLAFVVSLATKR